MTALDALQSACAEIKLPVVTRGRAKTAYVVSIGDYKEQAYGALSGWVYKVNSVMPGVGVGTQTLSPGDSVTLYYTLDLGRDVEDLP